MRQNLYVYSLYRNPDLDNQIFYCLLASMAAVQTEDIRVSFLFFREFNGHHQEWLSSTTENRHGLAAFDFSIVSGCDQLVVGPTHARGGTLDLMMTDVPDLVWVAVVVPIGNLDHSSLSAVISMAQAVPNLCVRRKIFLKHSIGILPVVQYGICPCVTFGLLTILSRFWTNICPCWLDVMFQPRSPVCVTRISLGFMINAGMRLASSRRVIFSGPVIALGLSGKSLSAQVRANETHSEAKRQFRDRNWDVLMNVHSPHEW